MVTLRRFSKPLDFTTQQTENCEEKTQTKHCCVVGCVLEQEAYKILNKEVEYKSCDIKIQRKAACVGEQVTQQTCIQGLEEEDSLWINVIWNFVAEWGQYDLFQMFHCYKPLSEPLSEFSYKISDDSRCASANPDYITGISRPWHHSMETQQSDWNSFSGPIKIPST